MFGDVNVAHTVLSGTYDGATNTLTFTGCFENLDGQDPLGHIYVSWDWNVQTGVGNSAMWVGQCSSAGTPDSGTLQAMKLATTAQLRACYDVAGECPFADTDGDGVPDSRELEDDSACGRRDPFNPYDYYDVSVVPPSSDHPHVPAFDGVIDLPNDILSVILHFAPGGYDPDDGDEIFDRPAKMTNNSGTWNRGSPDGVIDLPNDILGVVLQFNPGGC